MPKQTGSNMETVRRSNRSAILKYINDNGPTSRKDLAIAIGLTPAAVTMICNNLLAEGIVTETGVSDGTGKAGRRQIYLDIVYDAAYVFAINIEAETTTVALCNLKGDAVDTFTRPTDLEVSPEAYLNSLADQCRKMMAAHPETEGLAKAVSLGIPGIVDETRGVSIKAYGVWNQEVDVREILERTLDMPVTLNNNVTAFAMAEQLYGMGRGHENLMIIKWGPGVGCAMIIDQHIYEGSQGKAAELGHFIVEKNGEKCNCGKRGCLETKVSYHALQKIAKFDMSNFGSCYMCADDEVKNRFDDAIDLFARSIVNSATIMAPNKIVISGKLFEDEKVRNKLIDCCTFYDGRLSSDRIVYTDLADREAYIGPVAAYMLKTYFE